MAKDNKPERPTDVADILLGVLSLVDQFGSILSQRGRDFRRTERGRHFEQSLSGLLGELSQTQKDSTKFVTTAMDRLLSTLNRYNAGTNGNGKRPAPRRNGKPDRKKSASKPKPRKSTLTVRS